MKLLTPSAKLVFSHKETLAQYAAMQIAELAQLFVARRGYFTLALSGGSTPQMLYELLATPNIQAQIPWKRTHIFWADERAVSPEEEGSNFRQAKLAFLDYVPIPTENVWRMKGELGSDVGAQEYADQLRFFVTDKTNGSARWPRLDLVLLGMGADGHTASLFPYSSDVATPTVAVEQEYQDRPSERISLTPVIINDARRIWFIVSGVGKAEMVHKVLRTESDPFRYPAQRIAPRSGRLTWMLDSGAAAKL